MPVKQDFFKVDNRTEAQIREDHQKRIDMEDKPYVPGDANGCGCARCKKARETGRGCK